MKVFPNPLKRYFLYKIRTLAPAYFAMVMTIGALSIAVYPLGLEKFALVLLFFNGGVYLLLLSLLFFRLLYFWPLVKQDISDHKVGPGFFTLVAGTAVLGSQSYLLLELYSIALLLWGLALCFWVIIMYGFFTAVIIRQEKPTLGEGVNGAWLLMAVGTQSVAVLAVLLSFSLTEYKDYMLFIALVFFFLGCMLYLNIITLIFLRFTFWELHYESLAPSYWINMGAVAITTLAGALLILASDSWPLLRELRPFLKGFTLFFWATGTWWIPLLVILTLWRYGVNQSSLRYHPNFWALTFPLAMYTTGTYQLSLALPLGFLLPLVYGMAFIATIAFLAVLLGCFTHLGREFYLWWQKRIELPSLIKK